METENQKPEKLNQKIMRLKKAREEYVKEVNCCQKVQEGHYNLFLSSTLNSLKVGIILLIFVSWGLVLYLMHNK